MDHENQKVIRSQVGRVILLATALFFLLLSGVLVLRERIPQERLSRIEDLIARGETADARRYIARIDDEALAERYSVRCDYAEAETAFAAGDYAAALEKYANAGSYADAEAKAARCSYLLADALFASGDYDGAAAAFAALGAYEDAPERASECLYQKALAYDSAGAVSEAAELYEQLGLYRDSAERLRLLAVAVTGIEDAEEALTVMRGLSREDREHMLALSRVRDSLPAGVIAVGFYHTVGLLPDGGVVACGDNSFGQCDTAALHDVVAVAAGAYHTVALHSDGSVSAVGRATEGQCATADWRGVVAVAAADYATFGLTRQGTLLCCGVNNYAEPSAWSALRAVAGGSYNLAALRTDGSVWSYPTLKGLDALKGAEVLAVNTGYAVAALADGSVVSTNFDLSAWSDIVALSASGTAILGLDSRGCVSAHFFRSGDALDFSAVTDAVAIAAGGTHFAVVHADGSVSVFGENAHGEAETASWTLKLS